MSEVTAVGKQHEVVSTEGIDDSFVIAGHTVKSGDTIVFTTNLRAQKYHLVVGGRPNRRLHKIVAGEDRFYAIIPVMELWVGDRKSGAIAVAYNQDLHKAILMDRSGDDSGAYRSRGISTERGVTDVSVVVDAVKSAS